MAIYKQNREKSSSIAEKIANMLYRDITNFGNDEQSIYRQNEEEIMLWYLAGHHGVTPETTVAEYEAMVENKKVPGLITLSTSIHKAFKEFARDLFEQRQWTKHDMEIDEEAVINTIKAEPSQSTDHQTLLNYYVSVHQVAKEDSLFESLLRPAGARKIPSVHVGRLRLMRARKRLWQ